MTKDQIIRTIAGMRDRENVQEVREAANQRDLELMEHESYRVSKRVFERFAHLKRGDQVFVHLPAGKLTLLHRWMHGRPLTVWAVHPKNRAIEVRSDEIDNVVEKTGRRVRVTDHWGKPKLDPATGKALWRQVTRTVERPRSYLMRWSVLEKLKVSTKPTPEALAYVLKGGKS
jgi:hypothetical protein